MLTCVGEAEVLVASPQLVIPKDTLSADTTYTVKLKIEMSGDASKTSSKNFRCN